MSSIESEECVVCFTPFNKNTIKREFACNCTKPPNICKSCYLGWEKTNQDSNKNTTCPHCRSETRDLNTKYSKALNISYEYQSNLTIYLPKKINPSILNPYTIPIINKQKTEFIYHMGLIKIIIDDDFCEFYTTNSLIAKPFRFKTNKIISCKIMKYSNSVELIFEYNESINIAKVLFTCSNNNLLQVNEFIKKNADLESVNINSQNTKLLFHSESKRENILNEDCIFDI